jgi:hypothetical protein
MTYVGSPAKIVCRASMPTTAATRSKKPPLPLNTGQKFLLVTLGTFVALSG